MLYRAGKTIMTAVGPERWLKWLELMCCMKWSCNKTPTPYAHSTPQAMALLALSATEHGHWTFLGLHSWVEYHWERPLGPGTCFGHALSDPPNMAPFYLLLCVCDLGSNYAFPRVLSLPFSLHILWSLGLYSSAKHTKAFSVLFNKTLKL